jgi:hypothetical protein
MWNMEWTIVKEEKNPTIWFFHFVVKLQPFLEQNSNHPCFCIPLLQKQRLDVTFKIIKLENE